MTSKLRDYAFVAWDAGLAVLPPRQDGSKAPDTGTWADYTDTRPSRQLVERWYSNPTRTGIGVITGKVSGNLRLFEFDDKPTYDTFKDTSGAVGLGALVERIEAGYCESTPGGGLHWLVRCDVAGGNTKLARRPRRPEEMRHPNDKTKTLIETKEEGGYVIVAPSNGTVHETGGRYELVSGSLQTIATITADEWRSLCDLAKTFDEMPTATYIPATGLASNDDTGVRPGDDFDRKATWDEILPPHGWTAVHTRADGITLWRRPGKQVGVSATTGAPARDGRFAGEDRLYIFTTSTEFESERGYTKFQAYAILNHAGDFASAASELSQQGYGEPTLRHREQAETFRNAGNSSQYSSQWRLSPQLSPDASELVRNGHVGNSSPIRNSSQLGSAESGNGVLPQVVLFPVDILPTALRKLVDAGSASLPCPPDYVAVPLLVLAGNAIGPARELRIKDGWTVSGNLYAGIVGDTGAMKSPALKLAASGTYRRQSRLNEQFKQNLKAHETEHREWDRARKQDPNPVGPPPAVPVMEHVFADDATMEALGVILAEGNAVCVLKDEFSGWVLAMDQYRQGRGADRQRYLSCWDRSPFKIDRKTGPPLFVESPHLSVLGCIPPSVLALLADPAGREDGFVDRIWFSYPDPVEVRWTPTGVDTALIDEVEKVFNRLFELRQDGVRCIGMSSNAQTLWGEWFDNHHASMQADDFDPRLRGFWAKMPSQAARFALILQVLRDPDSMTLSAETLADALTLAEYAKSHTRRVVACFGNMQGGNARAAEHRITLEREQKILAALQSGEKSQTELARSFSNHLSAKDLRQTLYGLEAVEAVAKREVQSGVRGPATTYWRLRDS